MNRRSAWGMKQAVSYMPSVKGLPGLKSVIVWLQHNSASCGTCYYCKKGQESMCVDLIQNQFTNGAYAEYQLIPERNRQIEYLPYSGRNVL